MNDERTPPRRHGIRDPRSGQRCEHRQIFWLDPRLLEDLTECVKHQAGLRYRRVQGEDHLIARHHHLSERRIVPGVFQSIADGRCLFGRPDSRRPAPRGDQSLRGKLELQALIPKIDHDAHDVS